MAALTGNDAILKEIRDLIIRNDEEGLKDISPYKNLYWHDVSIKHGCLRVDEQVAIPKTIEDAVPEDIYSTHPRSFAMLSLAQNLWLPYIHHDMLAKASECKACTEIGKNLKPVIPRSKWSPLPNCIGPNDELQVDFVRPIINEKGIEQYFLTGIYRYSKNPTLEILNNASIPNENRFIKTYIYNHDVHCKIRLDKVKCLKGKSLKNSVEKILLSQYMPPHITIEQ